MEKKLFYNVRDIIEIYGVKQSSAYRLIQVFNEELSKQAFYTQRGVVNAEHFRKRVYA
ncbi:MAG: transcriptional regulator [Clostridia bacterium]|nr:transcriptional regulator [Clostridia bacterium]